jgi:hypothetical protein
MRLLLFCAMQRFRFQLRRPMDRKLKATTPVFAFEFRKKLQIL